jgi:chromosome segregation ATPase
MKARILIGLGLLVGLALLLVVSVQSCRDNKVLGKRYEELKAEYAALREAAVDAEGRLNAIITQQEKAIAELDASIADRNKTIQGLEKRLSGVAGITDELEAARATLTDKDAIIANLDEQVSAWKVKFNLAQDIIKEKDEVIRSLSLKYDSQVVISESWKAKYQQELSLRLAAERVMETADRQIASLKRAGKVKNILIATAVAGAIYGLAK